MVTLRMLFFCLLIAIWRGALYSKILGKPTADGWEIFYIGKPDRVEWHVHRIDGIGGRVQYREGPGLGWLRLNG